MKNNNRIEKLNNAAFASFLLSFAITASGLIAMLNCSEQANKKREQIDNYYTAIKTTPEYQNFLNEKISEQYDILDIDKLDKNALDNINNIVDTTMSNDYIRENYLADNQIKYINELEEEKDKNMNIAGIGTIIGWAGAASLALVYRPIAKTRDKAEKELEVDTDQEM